MPRQDVEFTIIYRGKITIPAGTQRDADLIVENKLDPAVLEKHATSVEVIAEHIEVSRS